MSRNEEFLKAVSFKHEHAEPPAQHVMVYATHPDHGVVGTMRLAPHGFGGLNGREIRDIDVGEQFRRQGIGSGMFKHAMSEGLTPMHSRFRTDLGDSWANSVGGSVPERHVDK